MECEEPPDGGGGGSSPPDIEMSVADLISADVKKILKAAKRAQDSVGTTHTQSKRDHASPPTASVQHSFTLPEFNGTKLNYGELDKGPFIVHVARVEPDPSAGLTIRLLKFAQLIYKNKIPGVLREGIKSAGRNRVVVEFNNASHANTFIDCPLLSEHGYKATIPSFHITRMGIVKNIPIDWSMEEFLNNIECTNSGCKAIKARRLNRKSFTDGKPEWIPTQTVVVTFLGQILPEKNFCCYTSLPVGVYTLPTIQCNNCCRFGHIQDKCRSKPRCFKCSQPHSGQSCSVPDSKATCLSCSGPHFATNPNCPEHKRQKSIKMVMSEENIPYSEASLRYRPVRRTFADSTRLSFSHVSPPNQSSNFSSTPSRPPMSPLTPVYEITSPLIPSPSSYRKTVLTSPRPHPHFNKGFDEEAHSFITSSPKSSQPNGCALINSGSNNSQLSDIIQLLFTLIEIITKHNIAIPNNVSEKLNQFAPSNVNKNGVNSSTMELQEHSS